MERTTNMIKMTYGHFSGALMNSFNGLMGQRFTTKVAYSLKKLNDEFELAQKRMQKEYRTDVMDKYFERDEKGEFKTDPKKPNAAILIEATKAEFEKAREAFDVRELVIDRPQLSWEIVPNISASEMSALEPIFEPFDENKKAPVIAMNR